MALAQGTTMTPIIFRAGIVYGRDIKMIRAVRWMLRHRVMAIWKKPTWAHLLALPDFLAALQTVIESESADGIYQLDKLADYWQFARALRLPEWSFHSAGALCELVALMVRTAAPLNPDIVNAGMTSCVADTTRMKREVLSSLAYPTIDHGLSLL